MYVKLNIEKTGLYLDGIFESTYLAGTLWGIMQLCEVHTCNVHSDLDQVRYQTISFSLKNPLIQAIANADLNKVWQLRK